MRNKRFFGLAALVLAFGLVVAACGDDDAADTTTTTEAPAATTTEAPAPELGDIVDIAVGAGSFETLVAAVAAADLVETLKSDGPFTVFAPTDEAFGLALDALGITAEDLLADTELLTDILLYHVVPGAVFAETVVTLDSATTAQGADITIEIADGGVVLNGAVNVITTDIEASNGVIHVIDFVLLPPADEAMDDDMGDDMAEAMDIVDTAIAAGGFETLIAAVQTAGLEETLRSDGPFTVFAPTDEAFGLALEALDLTAEELLASDGLADILLYHVVPGAAVYAETVVTLDSATTAQGADIAIAIIDGGVVLNETVNVIVTDIEASNGVIHVIDFVLLPPAA
jgi:uncharacterized surface protein with fasciclin (FAS1) repeats